MGSPRLINYESYINQKFHHLTILEYVFNFDLPPHKRYQFKCKCDCGNICFKKCNDVIHNKIQSCGSSDCQFRKGSINNTVEKYKRYIGYKINHITIIDIVYHKDDKNDHRTKFKVKCDCGVINTLDIHAVLHNKYKTCGYLNCPYSRTGLAVNKYQNMIGQKINNLLITDFIYNDNEDNQYYRYQFKCKCDCGNNNFYIAVDELLYRTPKSCNLCSTNSSYEISFNDWLKEENINTLLYSFYESNQKNIQQKIQIDFLLENKIGIELHGLITHSTYSNDTYINFDRYKSKPRNYHLNKLETAINNNIDLLQFWNFEWELKNDIVKSIILNRLNRTLYRQYARNCYVKEIDKETSDNFLIKNHIQGTVKSDSVRLGLFYKLNNNLVAVMTFGKSRYDSNNQWELYRFTNMIYCNIIGGASKLFKYFIKNYNPESIVSYSDRRLFNNGKVYEILGFKLDHISKPDYWYFKSTVYRSKQILYHRSQFMKHLLSSKLSNFDPNLTEVQNMENNGYLRVFDCGNKVYIWNKIKI